MLIWFFFPSCRNLAFVVHKIQQCGTSFPSLTLVCLFVRSSSLTTAPSMASKATDHVTQQTSELLHQSAAEMTRHFKNSQDPRAEQTKFRRNALLRSRENVTTYASKVRIKNQRSLTIDQHEQQSEDKTAPQRYEVQSVNHLRTGQGQQWNGSEKYQRKHVT